MQRFGVIVASHLGLVAAGSWDVDHLQAIKAGKVPKSQVELVLAQYEEDIDWSEPYHGIRTVYCKGGARCAEGSIQLPNVGREGHTYLKHIVDNYDNLADWTVFSQAEAPSDGYFGQGRGGGHLVSGISFEDYLLPRGDSHFVLSSKVHLPSLQHSIRAAFRTQREGLVPKATTGAMCPAEHGEDLWGEFMPIHNMRQFLSKKCTIEENAFGSALEAYWEDFVKAPMPSNEVAHYAQGARFAVSRQRVQQRSKVYYQQLLEAVSHEVDPCLNYLYELSWYYMMGPGQTGENACQPTEADVTAGVAAVRELQGGASGSDDGDVIITGSMTAVVQASAIGELLASTTFPDEVEGVLNETLGVNLEYIEVTLSEQPSPDARRLQTDDGALLKIEYTITIPEEMATMDITDHIMTQLTPGSLENGAYAVVLNDALEEIVGSEVTVQLFATPDGTNLPKTTSKAIVTDGAASQSFSLAVICAGVTAALYLN